MPIPHKIHWIWLGKTPCPDLAFVGSVDRCHESWEKKIWTDHDLWEFGLRADGLIDEFGNYAAASNYVRLLILKKYGGIYLDTDFECYRPMDSLCEYAAIAAMQDESRICNAFMGAEPDHPWINWQIEHLEDFEKKDGASGVYLATAAPRDGLTLIETHLVYPWLFNDPEEMRKPHPDSYLQHFWRGSWL